MTLLKFCLLRNHWCLDLIDLIAYVYNVIFRIRPYCHKFQMSFKTMLYAIFHRFYFHQ